MARLTKRFPMEHHIQPRGWGHERWIENLPEYCGKQLVIDPGKRGSLHFHVNKTETMWVTSGTMTIRLVDTDTGEEYPLILAVGDSLLLRPGQPHQICNEDPDNPLVLIEFSTTHEETDSRRVRKGD